MKCLLLLLTFYSATVAAFVAPSLNSVAIRPTFTSGAPSRPICVQNQRQSVATVQLQGLFGLGAPELVIIGIAAAFLLGPEKLASLGKDAGKMAGELKEVPKEFQRGLEEGEIAAKAAKAKEMVSAKEVEKVE
jgi:sec-independent protein translocase protein TatA